MMWTLHDGLDVVRRLQPQVRPHNYHIAIGGGVVNKGQSDKDLDLYFLPLCNGKCDYPSRVMQVLQREFGQGIPIGGPNPDPDYYEQGPWLHKMKYFWNGKRIDAFIGKQVEE